MEDAYTSLEHCLLLQAHNYPGVYFLRQGEEIVYVGQSRRVMSRIAGHIGSKAFDSILIMPVPRARLDQVESYWIGRLKPICNNRIPKNSKDEIGDAPSTMPTIINEQVALVDGQGCLDYLFPDPCSRPSLRWLKYLQHDGVVPYHKIGRRVFFDVAEVRRALDKRCKRTM